MIFCNIYLTRVIIIVQKIFYANFRSLNSDTLHAPPFAIFICTDGVRGKLRVATPLILASMVNRTVLAIEQMLRDHFLPFRLSRFFFLFFLILVSNVSIYSGPVTKCIINNALLETRSEMVDVGAKNNLIDSLAILRATCGRTHEASRRAIHRNSFRLINAHPAARSVITRSLSADGISVRGN